MFLHQRVNETLADPVASQNLVILADPVLTSPQRDEEAKNGEPLLACSLPPSQLLTGAKVGKLFSTNRHLNADHSSEGYSRWGLGNFYNLSPSRFKPVSTAFPAEHLTGRNQNEVQFPVNPISPQAQKKTED